MHSQSHLEDLRELTVEEVREYCQANPEYVHETDGSGETPLMSACLLGRTELVRVLLEFGGQVNYIADDGDTPLKMAIEGCNEQSFNRELFDLLLTAGANPNAGLFPAFHLAVGRGLYDVVRFLAEHGADPNLRDADDSPPLFWAGVYSNSPNVKMMGLLVNLGADINQCDGVGRTIEQRFGREVMIEVQRHSER
ncbi:ankyrin repeat domain-containing protein [Aeoliella mucimassa]|uniref:Ankyrin repeat protein n=1 Tax=Aeoliella mucimassa TaxID=2527972 RepID=A0A518AVT8_9BACT|nr:ankyrin repeat domain-containing protein [Aeoliella mucimassa]QDU58846.1 Ankyrin repeat protein [Aeoliella mucimassa]